MARHCELIKSQNTEGEKHAQHMDNIKSVKKNVYKRTVYSGKTFIKTRKGTCTRCGRNHDDGEECPAKGRKCNKVGHYAAVCHLKAAVHKITEANVEECMFLGSVQQEQSMINSLLAEDEPPWRTTLTVAHTPVSFKIDSGAEASVMSETTYETLKVKPKLVEVKNRLQSPGGVVATRGQFLAKIKCQWTATKLLVHSYGAGD